MPQKTETTPIDAMEFDNLDAANAEIERLREVIDRMTPGFSRTKNIELIRTQILHLEQTKALAIRGHKRTMQDFDHWIGNCNSDLLKELDK